MSKLKIVNVFNKTSTADSELVLYNACHQYDSVQKKMKELKQKETELKDILKQYDFEKIVFTFGDDQDVEIFKITQYETTRKSHNWDKFWQLLEKDKVIKKIKPDKKQEYIDKSYDEKTTKAIKMGFEKKREIKVE